MFGLLWLYSRVELQDLFLRRRTMHFDCWDTAAQSECDNTKESYDTIVRGIGMIPAGDSGSTLSFNLAAMRTSDIQFSTFKAKAGIVREHLADIDAGGCGACTADNPSVRRHIHYRRRWCYRMDFVGEQQVHRDQHRCQRCQYDDTLHSKVHPAVLAFQRLAWSRRTRRTCRLVRWRRVGGRRVLLAFSRVFARMPFK